MKSIKPGRGPSMMGGIVGIAVALFGVFWTIMAVSFGAGFMAVFGIIFVFIAIVQVIYNFKNATSKNRYSSFDIVDSHEEPDPLNERFVTPTRNSSSIKGASSFCPYCGNPVSSEYAFCNKCGKMLPV